MDDAGQPIPAQTVTIHVTRESDPRDPQVIEGLRAARPCDRSADRPPAGLRRPSRRASGLAERRDDHRRGRTILLPRAARARSTPRATLLARLEPRRRRRLPISRSICRARASSCASTPTPHIVLLDAPKVSLEAAALVDDDGTTQAKPGLALVLANEKNEELGRSDTTDGSGRARFSVDAPRLGPPGRGSLRCRSLGDAQTAFAAPVAEDRAAT